MKKKKSAFKEINSFIYIVAAVMMFRSVLFEPFKIPTGSMIPTLSIGDFILVNKFSFGFKLPFSDWFTDPIYLNGPKKIQRGDVIVFKYPKDESLNYIKRVIGLPGDTVEVVDKVVYVNNQAIKTEAINGAEYFDTMLEKDQQRNYDYFKTYTAHDTKFPHISQHTEGAFYLNDFDARTVPDGHYFVMGDNRDNSADSRLWGYVPFNNIKGKAIMTWLSLNLPMPGSPPGDNFKFRWEKIGKLID